ncbi:MAG: winged helix-turn-helix domain-containing protein [Nitrosopumilaceae archaeon]
MKKQYRTELLIISDILNATMDYGSEGTIISSIARRANLSHDSAVAKCQKLIQSGLIETKNEKKKRIFIITEKGIEFFHQIQKFIEIALEINRPKRDLVPLIS